MNGKKLVITSPAMLQHIPPITHVEKPDRLESLLKMFKSENIDIFTDFQPAGEEEVRLAHSQDHLEFVTKSHAAGLQMLDDGDTYGSPGSLNAAYTAVGAGIAGMEKIYKEGFNRIFCAVRPPGHHAERDKVMGFCYFNNIAIAVKYAQKKAYIVKAAIIDWDVHHGNGTQDIFYADSSVLFVSLHQMPLWPGTGTTQENGTGSGAGFTINIPIAPGSGYDIYARHFADTIIPAVKSFSPEIICISAGFDAHKDDPLAQVNLTSGDYTKMTKLLTHYASEHDIPILSMLEGGYNIPALTESVKNHIYAL